MTTTMTGAERIAAERERQMKVEGWSASHDDEHEYDELAWAAVCYAAPDQVYVEATCRDRGIHFGDPWPATWDERWDKRLRDEMTNDLMRPGPEVRIRMLEKAGALIAAEIDRLLRAASRPVPGKEP